MSLFIFCSLPAEPYLTQLEENILITKALYLYIHMYIYLYIRSTQGFHMAIRAACSLIFPHTYII